MSDRHNIGNFKHKRIEKGNYPSLERVIKGTGPPEYREANLSILIKSINSSFLRDGKFVEIQWFSTWVVIISLYFIVYLLFFFFLQVCTILRIMKRLIFSHCSGFMPFTVAEFLLSYLPRPTSSSSQSSDQTAFPHPSWQMSVPRELCASCVPLAFLISVWRAFQAVGWFWSSLLSTV